MNRMKTGATYLGNGRCQFVVWAPLLDQVALKIVGPQPRLILLGKDDFGYWQAVAEDIHPGTRYLYAIGEGVERPDPASSSQPEGVHGPSAVIDHRDFEWQDGGWRGVPPEELIIYELHIGTFTQEGSFGAVITRLGDLRRLGVTALEIMRSRSSPASVTGVTMASTRMRRKTLMADRMASSGW
jgi:maltooligosyltrehalose trehalohydrolase